MSISPINVTRVSYNLRSSFVADSLQRNQRDVFLSQARIASGLNFVSPSEDPTAAARTLDLGDALARQQRFALNASFADNVLAATDTSMAEISALITEARTIASQDLSNLTSAAEREADAELIAGIRRQLQIIGNREFNGRFLFAGRDLLDPPFVDALGGIAYVGDVGDLTTRVDKALIESYNVPGNLLYGALTSRVASNKNLSPLLSPDARLDDLGGAAGQGIRQGTLVIREAGGQGFAVDLTQAQTIGEVVELINAAATEVGAEITASLHDSGLTITPGAAEATITDANGGTVASDLGILTTQPTGSEIVGANIQPRVTMLTPLSDLAGGTGIDVAGGLVIRNGDAIATVDISSAETVQDVINAIHSSGIFVRARINDAGTGLELINQVSGTVLSVWEGGGTTAADLGLRTLNETTPLSTLNFGKGVAVSPGKDDLRITAADGRTVDVNLDGAETIGDVLGLINDAALVAGVAVEASLGAGDGIRISDATGGTGEVSVASLNVSTAGYDLGLISGATLSGTEWIGENRAGVRTEGVLAALKDLEDALRRDDTRAIAEAAERVDLFHDEVTRLHGVVGSRSQSMRAKLQQMQDAAQATEILLSETRDLDYAEAITRLQTAQTQLQAGLQTSSVLLNLSLLDFLR